MTICYNLSNSLPPERLEMLVSFRRIAESQGVPFLLVGATVRQLIVNCYFGIRERRQTRDLDFAVMLPSWDSFNQLANALVTDGGFSPPDTRRPHELRYGTGNWIDLVPFGQLSPDNTIVWPPEHASIMNIVGLTMCFAMQLKSIWVRTFVLSRHHCLGMYYSNYLLGMTAPLNEQKI